MSRTFVFISLIILSLISGSCKKNKDNIPDIYVDEFIYLSQPAYVNLNAIGGYVYLNNAGSRGIIVYRKSLNEFVALDRNCTFDPQQACATVIVDNTNFFASDTCCNSKFQINNGQVVQGPASLPLKAYQTEFDGSSTLHIYN